MKNILLISFGDYEYDGRLRELTKVFSQMGNFFCVTKGKKGINKKHFLFGGDSYFSFIIKTIKHCKNLNVQIDILVLDNRKAIIPGLILSSLIKPKLVIQDCRELYILREVRHFTGKIGCIIEKMGIKKADIIICANEPRAEIMQKIYKLKDRPISYENLRMLEYSSDEARNEAKQKFEKYIKKEEIRIISTSGCDTTRLNDVLVSNINKINCACRLFLVGQNSLKDESIIRKIIKDNNLKNVEIIGKLNQDELKFLISHCHIGIVNYNQRDTNNKYCASGKLFEFVFENVPIVTTTNPTLVPLCQKQHIGCADDTFYQGINEIINNYNYYKSNVTIFKANHDIEKNNTQLIQQLLERIELLQITL